MTTEFHRYDIAEVKFFAASVAVVVIGSLVAFVLQSHPMRLDNILSDVFHFFSFNFVSSHTITIGTFENYLIFNYRISAKEPDPSEEIAFAFLIAPEVVKALTYRSSNKQPPN